MALFLYSGKLEGFIELWDLDTKQKLRVIKAHNDDVMTLQMGWGYLWSASAVGTACVGLLLFGGLPPAKLDFQLIHLVETQHGSLWSVP